MPAPRAPRRPRPAAGRPGSAPRAATALLAAGVLSLGVGCQSTHRRLTVDSQPRGALVLVDGREIGFTPASISFDYYATRQITLVKDGFETQTFLQPIKPPLWQLPPAEFVTDNLLPGQVEDRHVVRRRLVPKTLARTEDVLGRADELRSRSNTER